MINTPFLVKCISSFAFLPAKTSSSKFIFASRDLISLSAMTKIQRKTNIRILLVHVIESSHISLFLNLTTKHHLRTWLSWTCLKSNNPVSIIFHDSSPPDSVNYKDVNLLLKSVYKGNNSRALISTIVKIDQAIGVHLVFKTMMCLLTIRKYDRSTRDRTFYKRTMKVSSRAVKKLYLAFGRKAKLWM